MAKAKKVVAVKRAPTPAEMEAMQAARERGKTRPVRPEPRLTSCEGVARSDSQHSDEQGAAWLLQDAIGSNSNAFVTKSLLGLVNAVGATTDDLGHALAIVAAVEPADELQSALAQQMAVTHVMSMQMMARAHQSSSIEAMNAYGNMATKFSRTFTAQIEALGKLRNGGAQVVRHVNVYQGGQAVVAEQIHQHGRGGQNVETADQPHGTRASEPARRPALPSPNPLGDAVPIPSCEGAEAVPDARRHKPRRASRK